MNVLKIIIAALFATAVAAQPSVDAVRVVSRSVERKLALPGEFSSYLAVDLHARVNGFVDKVNVDRGSLVKDGETLVTLVAPELAAQVAEAESKVRAAESQLSEAQAKVVADQSTYERLKAAAATPGAVAANELVVAQQTMEADRARVQALQTRAVVEPGYFASWLAPPAKGIDGKPADFAYVRHD